MAFLEDLSPDAQTILRGVHRFMHIRWGHLISPNPGNLTKTELFLLLFLTKHRKDGEAGYKVSELSAHFFVSPANITQLITGLEAQSLVTRTTDQNDRRVVRVSLSQQGEALARITGERLKNALNGLTDYLGKEDSQKLAALMNNVSDYMQEAYE